MTPTSPTAQTSSAAVPQTSFRLMRVGDVIAVKRVPSQCTIAPPPPTAHRLFAAGPQMPLMSPDVAGSTAA